MRSLRKMSLGKLCGLPAVIAAVLLPIKGLALPVSLGGAGPANWAVLEIGSGNVSIANASSAGSVHGNIGLLGGNASDSGTPISGSVFVGSAATLNPNVAPNVSGSIFTGQDVLLNSAKTAALNASSAAAMLSTSGGGASFTTINEGNNVTLNLAAGVYNLTDFKLQVGDVVNLAAGGSYVFNISGTLSLSSAKILTAAGLSSADVLFNVLSSQAVAFSGGLSTESVLDGIILAPNAQIQITPGVVNGEIISGQNIQIASGGSVNGVSVPDGGSSLLLLSLGVAVVACIKKTVFA